MSIKILDVIPPSQKQQDSGIMGTVNLMISEGDVDIVRLNGITVRKSGAGNMFLSEPSYSVGEGGDKKWWKHFMAYPGPKGDEGASQRELKDSLTAEVIRILDSGGRRDNQQAATVTATSTPSTATTTTAVPSDPWS